jgi:excinuclease UvrABC ATPase subunit
MEPDVTVDLPLGVFICVTGVSGSGAQGAASLLQRQLSTRGCESS